MILGLNSNASVPSRKTITNWIKNEYEGKKAKLKSLLGGIEWVCATADIWSARGRSFMGVICHWIDQKYERHSAILSMQRFIGSHTGDRIAEVLLEIFSYYKLEKKIVLVITDNGSNFVKAFRDYKVQYSGAEMEEDDNEDPVNEDEELEDDEVEPNDAFEHLNAQSYTSLPDHYRCVSHTLSLVATKNLNEVLRPKFYFSYMLFCIL